MKGSKAVLALITLLGVSTPALADSDRSHHWRPTKSVNCRSRTPGHLGNLQHQNLYSYHNNGVNNWGRYNSLWYNYNNRNQGKLIGQLQKERRDLYGDLRDERKDYFDDLRDADNRREVIKARREYDHDIASAWDEYYQDLRKIRQKYGR